MRKRLISLAAAGMLAIPLIGTATPTIAAPQAVPTWGGRAVTADPAPMQFQFNVECYPNERTRVNCGEGITLQPGSRILVTILEDSVVGSACFGSSLAPRQRCVTIPRKLEELSVFYNNLGRPISVYLTALRADGGRGSASLIAQVRGVAA
jgi:hypothetical protein